MRQTLRIGIGGDFNPDYRLHIATNEALVHAAEALSVSLDCTWASTPLLDGNPGKAARSLRRFDALWCSPGSPYQSTAGTPRWTQYAREEGRPFVGT